jgi:hypothetical protein
LAGHSTVLDGKKSKESSVNHQGCQQGRPWRQAIHGPDKPDSSEEYRKEKQVAENPVEQAERTFHRSLQRRILHDFCGPTEIEIGKG